MVDVRVHLGGDRPLPQVAGTLGLLRLPPRRGERGEQQRRECGDHPDDDEQLQKRERTRRRPPGHGVLEARFMRALYTC